MCCASSGGSKRSVRTRLGRADFLGRRMSDRRAMLRCMSEVSSNETCDCPRRDHLGSVNGRCTNPSLRSEEHADPGYGRYTQCGCCMADCPDVHPDSGAEYTTGLESVMIAEEYVATLGVEAQRRLRARAAQGEFRIMPRAEITARWRSR